jgi:hypothetical protein
MHNLLPKSFSPPVRKSSLAPERDIMPMTHFAIPEAGKTKPHRFDRLTRRIARFFGLAPDPVIPSQDEIQRVRTRTDEPTESFLRILESEPEEKNVPQVETFRWRRHAQLLDQKPSCLSGNEREARHEGVRGLFAARAGALECAENHFSRAAECDDIDLSGIPGFWQLNRSAMMTAVVAYERAGRIRDASALNARIRTMYRPRSLSPVPANVRHLQPTAEKVSSSS